MIKMRFTAGPQSATMHSCLYDKLVESVSILIPEKPNIIFFGFLPKKRSARICPVSCNAEKIIAYAKFRRISSARKNAHTAKNGTHAENVMFLYVIFIRRKEYNRDLFLCYLCVFQNADAVR